jgi:hypothetical protein
MPAQDRNAAGVRGRADAANQLSDTSMLCAQYGRLRNSEWVLKIAAFGVLVFAA